MEPKQAAEILRQLADGLDPATGGPLPKKSPFNQPDAIRALFTAIRALEEGCIRVRDHEEGEGQKRDGTKDIQHRIVCQVIGEEKTVKVLRMWTHYGEWPALNPHTLPGRIRGRRWLRGGGRG